jgi:hypothetical protein
MPRIAILDNVQHKHLRVIAAHGAAYGDAVMSALTFPDEFRHLQSTYPIVFAPNSDGSSYDALALFGFEPGENLFLRPDGWDGDVIPLSIKRQPFLIAQNGAELSVSVDLDHPRVSTVEGEGEPVFLSYGGTTEYMEQVTSTLRTLHDGVASARGFFTALKELDLIEPLAVGVTLNDGSELRLNGLYTIHEERLAALPGDAYAALARAGYLEAAYMAIASLSQFRGLIARRNRKGAAGA